MTLLELAHMILRITESKSEIVFHPGSAGEPQVRRPDIARARELLGWEPQVGVEEGLRRLHAFLTHGATLPSLAGSSFSQAR
jgi:nucleoside-diphosphate-sugar epimerase